MVNNSRWGLLLASFALLAVFTFSGWLLDPPVAPTTVTAGQFDQERAAARLQRILGDERPHPVDTPANDVVRERLVAELQAIGLQPQVREAMDCSGYPQSRGVRCSLTRNVIAVLPGPDKPALLLNAHYDSSPAGPGAADDGIGVATMLEVAELVKGEPRDRPIILLFNEGEEFGLNGATAFIEQDPLAKSVGKLINMESRGVSGPASMFETDTPNGRALADYAAATGRPYANSLTADLAKLIPNTTDVVMFKPLGWETLNFAIVGNEARYHTPGDTVQALSRDSLAHMGGEVLATTRQLAGPDAVGTGHIVYTDILGRWFLHMPLWGAALVLGMLLITAFARTRQQGAWRALGRMTFLFVGIVLLVALIVTIAGYVRPGDYWRAHPQIAYLAVDATLLSGLTFGLVRIARRHDLDRMRIAAWTLMLLVGGLISLLLPGATIFFLIGPILALVGMMLMARGMATSRALVIIAGLAQLVMLTQVCAIFQMLLIDGPLWAVAPVATLAALPLLVEVVTPASRPAWKPLGLVASGAWATAMLVPNASAERPAAFTIDYVRDDVDGKSQWAIASKGAPLPDSYDKFGHWKLTKLAYNGRTRWVVDAPPINVPMASLTRIANTRSAKGRVVTLTLRTGGANMVGLRFDDKVEALSIGLPGKRRAIDRSDSSGPTSFGCSGRSCDGLTVEVELASREPVKALLIATSGSPDQAGPLIAATPQPSHPQYAPHGAIRVRGYRL